MSRQRPPRSQDAQHWDEDYVFNGIEDNAQVLHHPPHYQRVPFGEEQSDAPVVDNNATAITPSDSHEPPKRISWWLWFVILTCLIILFMAVTFLFWLWFRDREDRLWRRVILSGRATQAITLTGVLIRASIGSLAAIMTSMIASIAVECHGVPISSVAEVSIARFTNAGPRSFFKLLLFGTAFRGWLRILTAVFLFLFVASEFTSTLLVTDLRESLVRSFNQDLSYGFTFDRSEDSGPSPLPLIGYAFNYWLNKPSSSEIFAEYSQPGKFAEDFHDTGPSIRAFLPIALQSERENLRSFHGMARVIDTRVVCVRPTFSAIFCHNPGVDYGTRICGNLTAELSNLPQHRWDDEWEGSKEQYFGQFNCPILDNGDNFPGQQTWALCSVTDGFGLISPLTNASSVESSTAASSSTWMIIDTASLYNYGDGGWNATSTDYLNSSGSGPWLRQWNRATLDEIETDYYIPVTLCFDYMEAAEIHNLNITAGTTSNSTEPVFTYDPETEQYDTWAVRNQIGAVRYNRQANNTRREILTISEQDMEESLKEVRGKPLAWPHTDLTRWLKRFLTLPGDKALAFCPLCSPDVTQFQIVDSLLTQVFNDVINTTDSPALALQAFNTLLYRTAYYDHISAFDLAADEATVTRFELVQAPQQPRGLMAVVIIIGGNLLLLVLVTCRFLSTTNSSFVENAWHTVAQISQSDEARPLLEKATLAADADIDDWVHERQVPKGFWKGVGYKLRGLFSQEKGQGSERLSVQNGIFAAVGSRG